jgi:Tol biopolymer transport system component
VPEVPIELERIVQRCLRKDVNRRIQTAADLRVSLMDVADQLGVEPAAREDTAEPITVSRQRRRIGGWIAAFAALVIAVLGLVLWRDLSEPDRRSPVLVRLTSDPGLTSFPAISPDGSLVAYASDREGQLDIYVQQVAGGPPIRLTRDATDDYEPAFSPDGSLIAFRSERNGGGIYTVPTLGGPERLIARRGRSPSFSPDGQRIAYAIGSAGVGATFSVGASTVHVVPVAGGESVRLAQTFPVAHHPQWTPDGRYVIFLGNRQLGPPTYDLWLVPPEGGEPKETGVFASVRSRGMTMGAHPFAVAGNAVIVSVGVGDSVNLWRVPVRADTFSPAASPDQLTFGTGREVQPSVSRDGRMVFSSGQQNSDVWELPIDANRGIPTGALRQLTREAGDDYYPGTSDDGAKIAFISKRTGNDDVWIHDPATGRSGALLVTPSAREMYPKLSADASVIAFTSIEQGKRAIYYMPSTGGVATRLCDDCGLLRDISPDGMKLLLQMGPPPYIGILDVATREVKPLLKHEKQPIYAPKLSPDGRWVAFQAVVSASARRMYVARLDSPGEWIPVTDGGTMDRNPFWSPDGNLLYFLSERDSFGCIWAQRIDAASRRAVGEPFAVFHFHEAMRSPLNMDGTGPVSPSIAKDRLVLSMGENRANIWMTRL